MAELFKFCLKLILQRPRELNAPQCEKKHASTQKHYSILSKHCHQFDNMCTEISYLSVGLEN